MEKIELSNADEAKNEKAEIFPQVRFALSASLGSFLCGGINGWSGTALTKMEDDFYMGDTETSLVVSMITYGSLVGSILAGKVMDVLGRRRTMLVIAPLVACGWAVIAVAKSIYFVYIGRFICGFATGFLFSSCPIYTSETCQPSIRGRLSSLTTINLTFGVLSSYFLAGYFGWRTSAFISVVPAVIFLVIIYAAPESPYWYLLQGKYESAAESLRILRGPNFNIEDELKQMSKKISDVGTHVSYRELLNKRTLLPLVVALFIQTLQQACGGNVIMMYTSTIFKKSKSSIDKDLATIYTGFAQLLGTIVSLFIIDKLGRKYLLAASVALCGVFIAVLGGYFLKLTTKNYWATWTPLVIIIGIVFSYCLGCRSIPWLIGGEIFNTSVRSRANSVLVVYNRLLNLLIVQIYPFVVSGFGDSSVFFIYGGLCFIGALGTLWFVPETKGKSLEEIQEYFEKRAS